MHSQYSSNAGWYSPAAGMTLSVPAPLRGELRSHRPRDSVVPMTVKEHFPLAGKRIWVAGHRGMVGSAVVRRLAREDLGDLIVADREELDMRRQAEVEAFVEEYRPDAIVIAAARVGGIHANQSAQAEFLYDNLMIAANAIEAARRVGI